MVDLAALRSHLAPLSLVVRGGSSFSRHPGCSTAETWPAARSFVLIGNVGGAFWPIFRAWQATQPVDLANPLDRWTKSVVDPIAQLVGARAIYPSDKPYQPFQAWAMQAEGLRQSPLGILIHPRYGPWHAYRAALLFDVEIRTDQEQLEHVCDGCAGQPCRNACPVAAHAGAGFAYEACLDWAGSHSTCKEGCLDRNACPIGVDYRYPRDMQAFLMDAFLKAGRA